MCGIAGVLNIREPGMISQELLESMTGIQSHRGPDESGIYIDDWAGLGHSRLGILDLSGGIQPIANENRNLWIVYNGEVFNYPELRKDLENRGHYFYTATDTEVILHLYEEKGPECLQEMNGQFAFAIWNSVKRELFLARDRVGIVPLHYAITDDRFVFASELKAIFQADFIPREIDPLAIDQIFTFWATIPGRTAFRNIKEIPPGHHLTVNNNGMKLTKWWDLPFCPEKEKIDWDEERIKEELYDLLLDAIKIRLRADVPVGAYLSGGLDSSGITTLISKNFNNEVKTFSVRFEDSSFDEGEAQKRMIDFLGVEHREIYFSNQQTKSLFQDVLWNSERPLLRTAPVPLYALSEKVRDSGFKVVLTGEGADEVFGGYNIFFENKIRRFWAKQPSSKIRPLLIEKLYPYIFSDKKMKLAMKMFFGTGLDRTSDPLFSHLLRWQNTSRIKILFSKSMQSLIGDYDCIEDMRESLPVDFGERSDFEKAQYLEMLVFMSNYLLSSQGDRVAMAHSVEIRVPYLDHRIIEFMAKIPAHMKIKGLNGKYILKKMFEPVLPLDIVSRTKKPFRAPIGKGLLDERSKDLLLSDEHNISDMFDKNELINLIKRIESSTYTNETDDMGFAGALSTVGIHNLYVSSRSTEKEWRRTPGLIIDRRTTAGESKVPLPLKI